MFNLEPSIAEWRKQMLAAVIKTPVPLEELEIHLREEIERQMKSETNAPLAFENALQQIGKADLLQDEFEKFEATKAARAWKQKQILFVACLGVISTLILACLLFKFGSCSELTSGQQLSGLAGVGVMILLAGSGPWGHRFFPVILDQRVRDGVGISAGLLVVIWYALFAFVVLPRLDCTVSQLLVAVLWAMITPTGILGGLIAGIETAAWKKVAPAGL